MLALQPSGALVVAFNDHAKAPQKSMPAVRDKTKFKAEARRLCDAFSNLGVG
jgi:hypothetical protein